MSYEYRIFEYEPSGDPAHVSGIEFLNRMSAEGWEYVEGMAVAPRERTVEIEPGRRVWKLYRDVLFRRLR